MKKGIVFLIFMVVLIPVSFARGNHSGSSSGSRGGVYEGGSSRPLNEFSGEPSIGGGNSVGYGYSAMGIGNATGGGLGYRATGPGSTFKSGYSARGFEVFPSHGFIGEPFSNSGEFGNHGGSGRDFYRDSYVGGVGVEPSSAYSSIGNSAENDPDVVL